MNQIAGLISCGICFYANTYMAIHARKPWLRTVALMTAGLSLVGICLNVILLALKSIV